MIYIVSSILLIAL